MPPMTLEDFLQSDAGQNLQLDLAALSDAERDTFMGKLQETADKGELESMDTDFAILQSQWAEEARDEAEALQAEQAQAVADGDYERAGDLALQAEYAMEEVQGHGGSVDDAEIVQAQADQTNLDYAADSQESAEQNATYAMEYAADGDMAAADVYAASADAHAEDAGDYAAQADQGGVYADQTVDTASTFDVADTSLAVDTTSVSTVDTTIDTSATE